MLSFSKKEFSFFQRKKLPRKKFALFARQMATLLTAGLPLPKSLLLLADQEKKGLFKKTLQEVINSLQEGISLSSAIAVHPLIFHELAIGLIQSGERTGMLGIVFNRLALFEEKREKLHRTIISILLYPSIVLIITLLIISLLLFFLIPKFESIFTELLHGASLPAATELLFHLSRTITHHAPSLITGILSFFFGLTLLCRFQKKRTDRLLLMIPLLGPLLQKSELARLLGTLGMLLENKVPILQALHIAQQITSNKALYDAICSMGQRLEEGDSMSFLMQQNTLFPPMTTSMMRVGEETGQLPEMLLKIASIYEEEVDSCIAQLISISEPLLLLFLALFVGSIVIALFLPLVSLLSGMEQ